MIIYILRHPETEFNIRGIVQGHRDSKLTPKGRKIAEKLGQRLKYKKIVMIYSSNLGRCLETSRIINKYLRVKIIPVKNLREQNYGRFNGHSAQEIKRKFDLKNEDLVLPGGESFNQMKKRVVRFVKNLRSKKPVLIVTHHGCLKAVAEEFNKKIKNNQYLVKIEKNKSD